MAIARRMNGGGGGAMQIDMNIRGWRMKWVESGNGRKTKGDACLWFWLGAVSHKRKGRWTEESSVLLLLPLQLLLLLLLLLLPLLLLPLLLLPLLLPLLLLLLSLLQLVLPPLLLVWLLLLMCSAVCLRAGCCTEKLVSYLSVESGLAYPPAPSPTPKSPLSELSDELDLPSVCHVQGSCQEALISPGCTSDRRRS